MRKSRGERQHVEILVSLERPKPNMHASGRLAATACEECVNGVADGILHVARLWTPTHRVRPPHHGALLMNTREYALLDFDAFPEYGMEKDAWLGKRRHGIGSTDAAGILGLDRYITPMTVYLDKIGEGVPVVENEMMHFGKRLEDVVAGELVERNGKRVVRPAAMYQHADHDFALASPDRLVPTELDADPLEVKTGRNAGVWENGPPNYYIVQVVHQMAVLGADRAHLAVLLNGRDYRDYVIERDVELEDILMEREEAFWRLVTERTPPAVDGHEATTTALKELYRRSRMGAAVELTDEQADWLATSRRRWRRAPSRSPSARKRPRTTSAPRSATPR